LGARLENGFPKCLTEVSGEPILGRLVSCLLEEGFKRLVVVVGHRGDEVREYLDTHATGLEIRYVECQKYATTNNIYSLWLAREHIQAPFVLIESDLVFDSRLLGLMRVANRIAVAKLHPQMVGTTVSFDSSGLVNSFRVGAGPRLSHKTVNIYSLSLPIWREVIRRLDRRIAAGRVNDYYEVVFAEMAASGCLPLEVVSFDDGRWSEVDTPADLLAAHDVFVEPQWTKGA
jgi:choline kinase